MSMGIRAGLDVPIQRKTKQTKPIKLLIRNKKSGKRSTNTTTNKNETEGIHNENLLDKTGLCKSTSRYCTWVTRNRWCLWDLSIERSPIMLARIKDLEATLCIACAGANSAQWGGRNAHGLPSWP